MSTKGRVGSPAIIAERVMSSAHTWPRLDSSESRFACSISVVASDCSMDRRCAASSSAKRMMRSEEPGHSFSYCPRSPGGGNGPEKADLLYSSDSEIDEALGLDGRGTFISLVGGAGRFESSFILGVR